jgi:hypothetical protein
MKSEVSITTMSSENRAGVANNAIHLSRHRRFLSLSVTQCGQVMASVMFTKRRESVHNESY